MHILHIEWQAYCAYFAYYFAYFMHIILHILMHILHISVDAYCAYCTYCTLHIVHIVHFLDEKSLSVSLFIATTAWSPISGPSCSRTTTYNHHHCLLIYLRKLRESQPCLDAWRRSPLFTGPSSSVPPSPTTRMVTSRTTPGPRSSRVSPRSRGPCPDTGPTRPARIGPALCRRLPVAPTGTRGRRPSMEDTGITYKTCACSRRS